MLLIVGVTLLSALVFIIYKAWIENIIQATWAKIAIESLMVILFIPLCSYFITSYVKDKQDNEFQQAVLKGIYSNSVDMKQLDEFIQLKYRDIFNSSTEDASAFAKKLLNELDKNKDKFIDLSKQSEEVIRKLYLKWKPFYEFMLSTIDNRIGELAKYDNTIEYHKIGHNPIIYDAELKQYTLTALRYLNIKGKTSFMIYYQPGIVRQGLLIKNFVITFTEPPYHAFELEFSEDGISLNPDYKKYNMLRSRTINDDPLDDTEFKEKTIQAINILISSSYIR